MAITGIITNEGLSKAIQASGNQGWYIKLGKFYVSDVLGELDTNRTISDMNPTWYSAEISAIDVLSPQVLQLHLTIPVNVTTEVKNIAEIYITAFNPDTSEEFLFSIQQANPQIQYDPSGSISILTQIKIQNLDLTDVFEFTFTYAQDIEDHNSDPNAHPHIRNALKKAGIFINNSEDYSSFTYVGQFWDEKAVFDSSVTDGMLVYRGTDGKYYPAIADGTEKSKVVGYADVTNGKVIVSGLIQTSLTYNAGTDLYLSDSNLGQFTNNPTPVKVGLSLGNGLILLGTVGGSGQGGKGDVTFEDLEYYSLLLDSPFQDMYYDKLTEDSLNVVSGNASYDKYNDKYIVQSGTTLETDNLLNLDENDYRFLVHIDSTESPSSIEYSVDDGVTWNSCEPDKIVTVSTGFKRIKFRFIFDKDCELNSYGVLYHYGIPEDAYSSDTRMFEVMNVNEDKPENTVITLPNGATYTPDGKSLEVYLNRIRLIPNIDYEEVDNRKVRFKIPLHKDDTIVFTEKFGYVDVSEENHTKLQHLTPSWTDNYADYIVLRDQTTGIPYKLYIDNDELKFEPLE